jgi:uncharacterized membrane protein
MTIRNPVVWGWDQIRDAASNVAASGHHDAALQQGAASVAPLVRRIGVADLRAVLAKGFEDFSADRAHYLFLCAIYPVIGLLLGRAAMGADVLHLVYPLVAGFALLGPFAAIGLYELSRRREQGQEIAWWDAFAVFRSPAIWSIIRLGLALAVLFVVWLVVAEKLYQAIFGAHAPQSVGAFLHMVLTTRAGWVLIVAGNVIGFVFAATAFALSLVSFPLMLDRDAPPETAVAVSLRAIRVNPVPMAVWGLIIAAGLVLGSIPFLLGLAVVMPVLGHATWHLYRRMVA